MPQRRSWSLVGSMRPARLTRKHSGSWRGPGWIGTIRPMTRSFCSNPAIYIGFEALPSDYYTGINAASKSLLAGEKETASQLAKRVPDIVGDKAIPADYWKTATVAEVQLLQRNFDAAARLYGDAVLATPLDRGSQETTYRQAQLLLSALDATDEQKAKIAAAFPPIN